MPQGTNSAGPSSDLDFADKLWQATDKLRGQVDAARHKRCGNSKRLTAAIREKRAGISHAQ